jgi:hypothetical protein
VPPAWQRLERNLDTRLRRDARRSRSATRPGRGACSKTGTYTWAKSGKTLRFNRVSDSASCSGRITILSHALTQPH